MEKNLKAFIKPVILKEEKYETASAEHCHQVKEECSPYQAKVSEMLKSMLRGEELNWDILVQEIIKT